MNGRRFLLTCVTLAFGSFPFCGAWGATLPPGVRTTTNGASVRPQVQALVEKEAAGLESDDPQVQATAREHLIDEVLPGGAAPAQPSAQFLDAYAGAVNTELLKRANHPKHRVRLNAAIVAAKVAEKASNAQLVPTIVDLLDDPNEAVVSWALRACKNSIGPSHVAAGAQNTKLMPAFVAAAKKYVESGPMIQIAYDSLRGVEGLNAPPAAVKAAVDATHTLLQARRDLYLKGIPQFAASENAAMSFLVVQKIWKAQTPAQQLQTVQCISDLASLVAQRFANADAIERAEMASILKTVGGALTVIGNMTDTSTKMDVFAKGLVGSSPMMATEKPADLVKAMYTGLIAFPAWKDLKPAPTIEK